MAALRTKVEIFYDVVSPYSWLAFEVISIVFIISIFRCAVNSSYYQVLCRYRPHWNMNLVLRPCFLGGIMKESGNRPPMMVPLKALYMNKDLIRNANFFQVPIKLMEVSNHTVIHIFHCNNNIIIIIYYNAVDSKIKSYFIFLFNLNILFLVVRIPLK